MTARMLSPVLLAMAATIAAFAAEPIRVTLVPPGSIWRLWDNFDAPNPFWNAPGFADTGWRPGPAQFGYGEGDEATWIAPGDAPHVATHYFRHQFRVARADDFTNLLAQVLYDDGVVVYLNGQEVFRLNLPDGPVHHLTYASARVAGTNENFYFPTNFSSSALVDGENTLAVELHQAEAAADASFDMSLTALGPPRPSEPSTLNAAHGPTGVTLQWDDSDVFLEQLLLPAGAWETLTNAGSPYQIPEPTDSRLFRLRRK